MKIYIKEYWQLKDLPGMCGRRCAKRVMELKY